MSYALHITRKNLWTDTQPTITTEEWIGVATKDSEFKAQDANQNNHNDYLYAWECPQGGVWPFYLSKGNIDVDHADQVVLTKAKAVATKLQAKVQGDDGELY